MRDHAGMMRGTDGMRDSLAIEGLPNIKTFICLTVKFYVSKYLRYIRQSNQRLIIIVELNNGIGNLSLKSVIVWHLLLFAKQFIMIKPGRQFLALAGSQGSYYTYLSLQAFPVIATQHFKIISFQKRDDNPFFKREAPSLQITLPVCPFMIFM